ncbi:hypothetical protein BJ322DRAFT_1041339 [Thelephora terrestris]|uniref:F-box domain-containing protein n=1 Tax=Thelephora terrestris TaxID=56493 RepID=A0A9P6HN85_9AGAM|nr:hypothetical protein BJ322DRAFT_1041339 [Thelephora terrestris]
MSTPVNNDCHLSQASSLLRATKKALQDVALSGRTAIDLNQDEIAVIEQDAAEVFRLIRSLRNALAPINKMPPEILTLIPDLWYYWIDSQLIALTHVCRTWREMFTSRSSLWTRVDCNNADKTRVFLERSKSSPINVSLSRGGPLPPDDPFFQIDHRAVKRLVSLHIDVTAEKYLRCITPRLFHPAPLLENLSIYIPREEPHHALTATLFGGDLSSLKGLDLTRIRTELPWRNMVNLTIFELAHTPPGEISTTQLLDFFESAPRLQEVTLLYVSPTSIDQDERLVSLACLKCLEIYDDQPVSPFICHLLIPVGANLSININPDSGVDDHLPISINNLRNLLNFTKLLLYVQDLDWQIEMIGPSGEVNMNSTLRGGPTRLLLGFLDWVNTSTASTVELILKITSRERLPHELAHRLLSPMNLLRTLTISPCITPCPFIQALNPDLNSESVLVCPRLETLVLPRSETIILPIYGRVTVGPDIEIMEAARELRGAKIKSVQIVEG